MFSQAKLNTDDAKDVSFLHLCNCVSWNMFTSGDAFRDFNFKHLHSCFFFWLLWSVMDLCRILVELSRENRGAFYSAKPFENVETAANGTEISLKSFQKFRKLLNFRMRTIQPKILEIPGDQLNGKTTSGKKIWVYLARLSPFWKFLKMLFHSLLKVVENLNRKFWLNGVVVSPLSNTG